MRRLFFAFSLLVFMSGVAWQCVYANMPPPLNEPRASVQMGTVRGAAGGPDSPAFGWVYSWDDLNGYFPDPKPVAVVDQFDKQIGLQYARNHKGRKLGAEHVGARADIAFTVDQDTKQIRVTSSSGEPAASIFQKEAVSMVKQVRLSKTWTGGPPEIDFILTIYSGVPKKVAVQKTSGRVP